MPGRSALLGGLEGEFEHGGSAITGVDTDDDRGGPSDPTPAFRWSFTTPLGADHDDRALRLFDDRSAVDAEHASEAAQQDDGDGARARYRPRHA